MIVVGANVPVIVVPTVTVVPGTMHFGKFAGNADSAPVGLFDKTNVPAPVASVVIVPTTRLPIETFSVVLAAAPVMLTENIVVVTPLVVLLVNVTVPAAAAFVGSANVPLNEALGGCPQLGGGAGGVGGAGGAGVFGTARTPISVPTVTVVVPATTVGKGFVGATCDPVGLVEMKSVPAPLAFVFRVPTTVVPIVTVSELLAASPVTLTHNVVLAVPHKVPVV